MKYIYAIILSSFFISLTPLDAQPVKIIYWLHGLGGDEGAWDRAIAATTFGAGTDFPSKKVANIALSYGTSQYSLEGAASNLIPKIQTGAVSWPNIPLGNNFMIAHSQGGLVGRQIDLFYSSAMGYQRNFHGLATFGTPHHGAQILNNKDMFSGFIDASCSALTAGPSAEVIDYNQISQYLAGLLGVNVSSSTMTLCNALTVATPLFFADFNNEIVTEYTVGGSGINRLNAANESDLHKVAFFGTVDPNTEAWRELSNILIKKPNVYNTFSATDQELVDIVKQVTNYYQAKVNQWQSYYDNTNGEYCSWWQWATVAPWCALNDHNVNVRRNLALVKRDAWKTGVNWWNTGNDRYRVITGSKSFQDITSTGYECNCNQYDYDGNNISSWSSIVNSADECYSRSAPPFVDCQPTIVQVTTTQEIDKQSDGVVLKESAEDFSGATYPVNTNREMVGSNHQKMRNDLNTKLKLIELFKGTYDTFFKTN